MQCKNYTDFTGSQQFQQFLKKKKLMGGKNIKAWEDLCCKLFVACNWHLQVITNHF